jgi:hypothetical protein
MLNALHHAKDELDRSPIRQTDLNLYNAIDTLMKSVGTFIDFSVKEFKFEENELQELKKELQDIERFSKVK